MPCACEREQFGGIQSVCVNGNKVTCMHCHRELGSATSAPAKHCSVACVGVCDSGCKAETPTRHPNSARFHELLETVGQLHDRKSGDYGAGDDPFANVRASEEWGIDGWVGTMIRLNDKVRRLQSLAKKGYLNNEAAVDSFLDIACYALIACVLYEQAAQS